MLDFKDNCLPPNATMKQVITAMEEVRAKIVIVVNDDNRLLGTVTDGDVRRAILKGAGFDDPVTKIMNSSPRVAGQGDDRATLVDLMRRNICRHIPILDQEGRIVGLESLDEIVEYSQSDSLVVLMAGGLGSRLMPLTENIPKPMLKVGGKPILQVILESFRSQGFSNFVVSLNYLGHLIKDHFGDGTKWGVNIEYVEEEKQLGTAGALSLLKNKIDTPLIVMNGDILTKVDFRQLIQFHEEHKAQATMCVREYHVEVPFGVIENDGHRIRSLQEKPRHRFLVNAGIYVIEPDVLGHVPENEHLDMPSLISSLVDRGQHACLFPMREYWLDVGRMDDFDRAQSEFLAEFGE